MLIWRPRAETCSALRWRWRKRPPTLLSFDVVDLDGQVQQALRDEIERDGVVLYEKD